MGEKKSRQESSDCGLWLGTVVLVLLCFLGAIIESKLAPKETLLPKVGPCDNVVVGLVGDRGNSAATCTPAVIVNRDGTIAERDPSSSEVCLCTASVPGLKTEVLCISSGAELDCKIIGTENAP